MSKKALSNPIVTSIASGAVLNTGKKAITVAKNNWKPILVVGSVALGSYLVYDKFIKNHKILEFDKTQSPTTLTEQEAKQLAASLYGAMKSVGTNKQDIKSILANKTKNDFVAIVNAFGKKSYATFGAPTIPIPFIYDELNLIEWLSAELSKSEFEEIAIVAPEIKNLQKEITIGSELVSASPNLTVKIAEKNNDSWFAGENFPKRFQKGEKIGKVIHIINDPWENKRAFIVRQPINYLLLPIEFFGGFYKDIIMVTEEDKVIAV